MRQRRVAGAEIVERDPDAVAAESVERGSDIAGIAAEEDRFGDFELQERRRDPALGERRDQHLGKAFAAEVRRGGVDRHVAERDTRLQPGAHLVERALDHAIAERGAENRIVERGHHVVGAADRVGSIGPAHQRFEADDPRGAQ